MKARISLWITAGMFFCTMGTFSAYATPASNASYKKPIEITGCLEQGPTAKEYLLKTSDGTTWGVIEKDMLMNDYVDRTVTVSGDPLHPTAEERSAGGAHHFVRAYDVVVESSTCQK